MSKRKFTMRKAGIEMATVKASCALTREQIEGLETIKGQCGYPASWSTKQIVDMIFSEALCEKIASFSEAQCL